MKVARTEDDAVPNGSSGDDFDTIRGTRLSSASSAPSLATCAGQHFFAVISAPLSSAAESGPRRTLQLDLWRHAQHQQQQQQQQQNVQVPDFSAQIIVPENFVRESCFIGEGTDGVSVVICDARGNAGAISVTSSQQQQQQQLFLHSAPMCGGSLSVMGMSRNSVITDFAAINGGIFLGTSDGTVSAVRVVDRESADKWIALTSSAAPSVVDSIADEEFPAHESKQQQQQQQPTNSWGSWFGSLFTGGAKSNATGSPVVEKSRANGSAAPPVVRVFPSSAARNQPHAKSHEQQQLQVPAWFSVHSDGRVVHHGPFNWVWRVPTPAAGSAQDKIFVLAVGDCPESRTVSVLFARNESDYFLATLPLRPEQNNNSSSSSSFADFADVTKLEFPRRLSLQHGDFARCSVFPVSCQGERRVIVVSPQFTAAFNIAVGPRAPHNEVTVIDCSRYTIAAQMIVTQQQSQAQQRELIQRQRLLLLSASGVGGGVHSFAASDVFSSFARESDRALYAEMAQFDGVHKSTAFLRASNNIACVSEPNPWNWSRGGGGGAAATGAANAPLVQNDLNLITFVSNSLSKRVTDHDLFLSRWSNMDTWQEVSEGTRAAVLENQIGLAILSSVRTIQNNCSLHRLVAAAFEQQQQQISGAPVAHSFDLFRACADFFAELLPRASRHSHCVIAPALLVTQAGGGLVSAVQQRVNGVSDAEVAFGHPRNGFSLLHEAACLLAETVRNINTPPDHKLMWAAVVGSAWAHGLACCQTLLQQYDGSGASNGSLFAQMDGGWLDESLPDLLAAMSDAVCFSVDWANSSNNSAASSSQDSGLREQLRVGIIELIGVLVSHTLSLHSQGRSIAPALMRRSLLREPLVRSSNFGYPFGFPQQTASTDRGSIAASRAALLVAERTAVGENMLVTLWELVSATNFAEGSSNNNDGASSNAANAEGQQRYRAFCERVPGFFHFSCEQMLLASRELELHTIQRVVPRVGGAPTEEVRARYLSAHAPSLQWTIDGSAIDAVLRSGYEPNLHIAGAPLADNPLDHRSVCVSLAKLAWAAEGRPSHMGRAVDVEAKVARAQKTFLTSSNSSITGDHHNQSRFAATPLSHAEVIRALLQMSDSSANNNNNVVAACELADCLHVDDAARPILLREILRKLFEIEGGRLVSIAGDQSIGDQARLQALGVSLTARTLNKSPDLLLWCNQPDDASGIATVTSPAYAQMLLQWRQLVLQN